MLKRAMAAAVAAASAVGMPVAAAPTELAIGNDNCPAAANGAAASSAFGNGDLPVLSSTVGS
ncbi:hypothetical protein [Streptomyces sp. NPDC001292]|uniref:hypothetical protein n=1 Tax=Streptomyces sp. NPDC001292 TaxID=3364558 RepID=UPI0036B94F32